ncbi:MAG: RnfABCDGE type electron transport complex subunit B [Oscillospiraceae bacterium]|nr:RnfABCDGE type electron transport complex subunit B [Oscillospiraceae bacterium]
MDMMIIYAAVLVAGIGAVCAIVLCTASKFMAVSPSDNRIEKITEILPMTNCGACGFPGCSGYAKALVSESPPAETLCIPGGAEAAKKLGEILGIESSVFEHQRAIVHCAGGSTAMNKKMEYSGIQTCMAAAELFGGQGTCPFGCLGYGDCRDACQKHSDSLNPPPPIAVCINDDLARIVPDLCSGCGLCVKACPKGLIAMEKDGVSPVVKCKNTQKGAAARKSCSSACIGCRKCVSVCPDGAIEVKNFLAEIDYEKCTGCNSCIGVCPTKCIQPVKQTSPEIKA